MEMPSSLQIQIQCHQTSQMVGKEGKVGWRFQVRRWKLHKHQIFLTSSIWHHHKIFGVYEVPTTSTRHMAGEPPSLSFQSLLTLSRADTLGVDHFKLYTTWFYYRRERYSSETWNHHDVRSCRFYQSHLHCHGSAPSTNDQVTDPTNKRSSISNEWLVIIKSSSRFWLLLGCVL